jgi:hypothetical protein
MGLISARIGPYPKLNIVARTFLFSKPFSVYANKTFAPVEGERSEEMNEE